MTTSPARAVLLEVQVRSGDEAVLGSTAEDSGVPTFATGSTDPEAQVVSEALLALGSDGVLRPVRPWVVRCRHRELVGSEGGVSVVHPEDPLEGSVEISDLVDHRPGSKVFT